MAAAAEPNTTPKKSGMAGILVLVFLSLLAIAGGFSLPLYVFPSNASKKPPQHEEAGKVALVSFGDAVVNLGEERLTRYLRVKIILVVNEANEKSVTALVAKHKPFLKSWLISYLSDQSLQEVTGAASFNRIRREVLDRFNAMLFPTGPELIQDILMDEFVVQ
jgi:flagellar basal body-associated protein FliL